MQRNVYYLTTAISLCLATTALSQETVARIGSDGVEEVVVVAQKREQNLQDVPIAVSAIGAETLVNRNVTNVSDLPRLAPSLTITAGTTPTNNSLNLRGIGTVAFSTGIEPSVAVIVDDVPLLNQAQAFSGLSDIARIEVLRGPQGTLFGKNASAGVINIASQKSSPVLSGSVTVTATDDDETRFESVLSGPLGTKAGFRLNAFTGDRKGYIRNLTDGTRLNGEKSNGVRLRLDYAPTDTVAIDVAASHSVTESHGAARPFYSVPAGAAVYGASLSATLVGITPGIKNFAVRVDQPLYNKSKQSAISGRVSVDVGDAKLVSVSSYQKWDFVFSEDFDMLQGAVLGLANGVVAGSHYDADQLTQELRLVSPTGGRFDYVAGLFFSSMETNRRFDRGPSGPALASWQSTSTSRTMAAFLQSTFDVNDHTFIDGGLRVNHERLGVAFQNLITPASPPANNATCLAKCEGNIRDNQVTGKIALRHDFDDHVMGYVSYSTGYKGQGYDVSSGFTPARIANPVRPETSRAYELGFKSQFFSNKVRLNVAGFWTDYDGFQAQSGVQLPDQTIQLVLNNVGKVRTRGVEMELSTRPIPDLTLDAGFTYTDALIKEFRNAQCYTGQTVALGCVDLDGAGPSTTTGQDLSGHGLPNAPKYKANINAVYNTALPGLPFRGFAQGDVTYQSEVNFDLLGNPATVQKGYTVANASFGIEQDKGVGYRLAIFANNLFDKQYGSFINIASGGTPGLTTINLSRNARRYVGVKLSYRF